MIWNVTNLGSWIECNTDKCLLNRSAAKQKEEAAIWEHAQTPNKSRGSSSYVLMQKSHVLPPDSGTRAWLHKDWQRWGAQQQKPSLWCLTRCLCGSLSPFFCTWYQILYSWPEPAFLRPCQRPSEFHNASLPPGHLHLPSPATACHLPGSCYHDSWLGHLGSVTVIPVDFLVPSAYSLLLRGPCRWVVTIYYLLQ